VLLVFFLCIPFFFYKKLACCSPWRWYM